jgi:pteridine reductase
MDEHPLALVTGAARRLGKVFALTLARRGYAIVLHYHHSDREAIATAEEIRSFGVPVFPVQANLTEVAAPSFLFSSFDSPLKVLINSAAVMPRADLRSISASDWDATLDLNLRAPFLLAQKAAEHMTQGGLIVNIVDVGASKLWTNYPAYVVSKSALETLTRLMAKTYAPEIRVNAIAPGLVLPSDDLSPGEWERLVARLPLERASAPGEIAIALEYLLDNQSVTGQTIVVDSGFSLV